MGIYMDHISERRKARLGWTLPVMAGLFLSACMQTKSLDWDLRNNGGATSSAVSRSTALRPTADAQGVISYPGYQVVVARRGDTVATVAARLAIPVDQLARYNALTPNDTLRQGEILALPVRVASTSGVPGQGMGTSGGIDVAAIATTALDKADGGNVQTGSMIGTGGSPKTGALPFPTQGSGPEPVRYQVKRGETAFTIARSFDITAKSLADWNGLGPDLSVREGQFLIIPTPSDLSRMAGDQTADATPPGQGSPTPAPPSSKEPLPEEKTLTAAQAAKQQTPAPDLGSQRTASSAAAMAMPVNGKILRAWDGKTSQGIDIAAAAGTAVHAADAGTVAVITHDAKSGALIVILRHANGLLTVYAGLDSASVDKGANVKRGQTIGTVKNGSPAQLHFEVRQGQASVDPLTYLQ